MSSFDSDVGVGGLKGELTLQSYGPFCSTESLITIAVL